MRTTFKSLTTLLISSSFILLLTAAEFSKQGVSKQPLDGKTFEMLIAKDGDKKAIPMKDNLIFKDGVFNTSYFMQLQKFPSGVYSTVTDASTGIITFKSQSLNKVKDNIAWVGKINGDHVEGTAKIFSKKTKSFVEYNFTGNLRKKSGQMKMNNDTVQSPSDSVKVQK